MAYTDAHLFFDDVSVGQEWESAGRTVTQADVVNFAGLSGDFNPIHMDETYAQETPFRKPIAHGLLVFSIGSGLGLWAPPMRTLAFLGIKDWRFLDPVFFGDTIRTRAKVLAKEERSRGRRGVVTWRREIFKVGGKTVQEGTLETLVEGRAAVREPADKPK